MIMTYIILLYAVYNIIYYYVTKTTVLCASVYMYIPRYIYYNRRTNHGIPRLYIFWNGYSSSHPTSQTRTIRPPSFHSIPCAPSPTTISLSRFYYYYFLFYIPISFFLYTYKRAFLDIILYTFFFFYFILYRFPLVLSSRIICMFIRCTHVPVKK